MEILLAKPKHIDQMMVFFESLKNSEDTAFFHPHSFSRQEILAILEKEKKDLYYIVTGDEKVLGYGILRGWDEGYSVPSLGVAVSPNARGIGIGKLLVQFLHAVCRERGCEKIRLKVYKNNVLAVKMYEKFGYTFSAEEEKQIIGYCELGSNR